MKWVLKKLKVAQLKEWDKNPRQLTEKGLSDLRKSIENFGVAEPLTVNTDYTICGGHGRKKVLQEMGIKEVDCYLPEKKLTPKQFEELNIRLNKNIAGVWDYDILANQFDMPDLIEYGFNEKELIGESSEKEQIKPEVEFTEELDEDKNYIVLKFTNYIDWLQLLTLYPLKTKKALDSKDGFEKQGVGRVVDGKDFLNKVLK